MSVYVNTNNRKIDFNQQLEMRHFQQVIDFRATKGIQSSQAKKTVVFGELFGVISKIRTMVGYLLRFYTGPRPCWWLVPTSDWSKNFPTYLLHGVIIDLHSGGIPRGITTHTGAVPDIVTTANQLGILKSSLRTNPQVSVMIIYSSSLSPHEPLWKMKHDQALSACDTRYYPL